jgi:branched-chain amino acid transport system substrate-binding protein
MKPRNLYIIIAAFALIVISLETQYQNNDTLDDYDETSPEDTEDKRQIIKIGVMLREGDSRQGGVDRLVTELAREDINRYCIDAGLNVTFEFVYSEATFNCDSGVLQLERFHENGIDLIIGATYNINLHCGAPAFARDHNMVMVSPTITANFWDFAFNSSYPLFRMSHTLNTQIKPMLALMQSFDIENFIVLNRADESGSYDWIRMAFEAEFESRGWASKRFGYMYNGSSGDYTPYLDRVISYLQEMVLLIESGDEFEFLIDQAVSRPILANLTWFTNMKSSHWPYSEFYRNGGGYSQFKLYGPILMDPDNDVYRKVNQTFYENSNSSLGLERAYIYDSCWILAKSVLEADTINGSEVADVVRLVASEYWGASGHFVLNEDGERAYVDYELRSFIEVDDRLQYLACGFYNGTSGTITWYEGL